MVSKVTPSTTDHGELNGALFSSGGSKGYRTSAFAAICSSREEKRRQEELVLEGPAPGSVLRATQFYEFPGQLLARSRGPLTLVPRMRVQPVVALEVAAALIAVATGPAEGLAPELAGPQEHEMVDLARRMVRAHDERRPLVGIRIPSAAGRAMADGGLRPNGPGPRGRLTFEQWLPASTFPIKPSREP